MLKFNNNSNIVISGCSGSGKTCFVKRVLQHLPDMFETVPTLIIYCYNTWQEIFDDISNLGVSLLFTRDIPTEGELGDLTEGHPHSLLICDDKMEQLMRDSFMSHLFTRSSHHHKCTTILLLQNSTCNGKNKADFTKNCHYSILMRSPRDHYSIRALGVQLGEYRALLDAYNDATNTKWGYLLCDTHPNSEPAYKFRTNIFPDDEQLIVYKKR